MMTTKAKMTTHTPGPWEIRGRHCPSAITIYAPDSDWVVATTEFGGRWESERPTCEANATRIVACVNALAGIADPVAAVALLREIAATGEAIDALLGKPGAATQAELVNVVTGMGRRAKEVLGR